MHRTGNIVCKNRSFFGTLTVKNGRIDRLAESGPVREDAEWILPGFIDVHLHGIYHGAATPEAVHRMAEEGVRSGLTTFCPTMASDTPEQMLAFVETVRELMRSPRPGLVKIAGSHLEGPYMEFGHKGGMNPALIRDPDPAEVRRLLDAAQGTLKIMTISPELPGALEVTRLLAAEGVLVSGGHTGLAPDKVEDFIAAGGKAFCHLFDTYDGREARGGVMQTSLADAVLIDDRLFVEVIGDGIHVPPPLVKLAVRAAGPERILGITDSVCGTGLPDGSYPMTDAGRAFTLRSDDVARLVDDPSVIVGSCLTQNRAFCNYTAKFGFAPEVAMQVLATTPARYLGLGNEVGELREGLRADLAVLAPDRLTVRQTVIAGEVVHEQN